MKKNYYLLWNILFIITIFFRMQELIDDVHQLVPCVSIVEPAAQQSDALSQCVCHS